jgi:hypothetical protein
MANWDAYDERELRMIGQVLELRMASVLMQTGQTPSKARGFAEDCIATALKIAHCEQGAEMIRGPLRLVRA